MPTMRTSHSFELLSQHTRAHAANDVGPHGLDRGELPDRATRGMHDAWLVGWSWQREDQRAAATTGEGWKYRGFGVQRWVCQRPPDMEMRATGVQIDVWGAGGVDENRAEMTRGPPWMRSGDGKSAKLQSSPST